MSTFREIVTKSVIGKGKKTFSNTYTLTPESDKTPTTILGCWVINHLLVVSDNHCKTY